jgi:hypothetical protein
MNWDNALNICPSVNMASPSRLEKFYIATESKNDAPKSPTPKIYSLLLVDDREPNTPDLRHAAENISF